jgi:predicted nucleic acid-binding protein
MRFVQFEADWARRRVVPLSSDVCSAAVSVALQTGARTLDALHVAAALEVTPVSLVAYDRRLAAAASSMGLEVLEP